MEDKKITVSEQIRQLHDVGMKVKEIAKTLGIRYQFAYNVVSTYLTEQRVNGGTKVQDATQAEIAVTIIPTPAAAIPPEMPKVPAERIAEVLNQNKPLPEFKMQSVEVLEGQAIPPRGEVHPLNTKESVLARLFRK